MAPRAKKKIALVVVVEKVLEVAMTALEMAAGVAAAAAHSAFNTRLQLIRRPLVRLPLVR